MLPRIDYNESSPSAWHLAVQDARNRKRVLGDLTVNDPTSTDIDRSALIEAWNQGAVGSGWIPHHPDPAGSPSLRAILASRLGGWRYDVHPDDILLASSTSEFYSLLFRTFVGPEGCVLVPEPGYPLLSEIARLDRVVLVPYRLRKETARGWVVDRKSVLEAWNPSTRLFVVVQPGNPLGDVRDQEDAIWITDFTGRQNILVVVDEVFRSFPPHGQPATSWTAIGWAGLEGFVLEGLSKSLGFPQAKIAWAVARGEATKRRQRVEELLRSLDAFLPVAGPVQEAVRSFLRPFEELLLVEPVHTRIQTVRAVLEASRIPVKGGGWSVCLPLNEGLDDEDSAIKMAGAGWILHPGHFYDHKGVLVGSLLVSPSVWSDFLSSSVAREMLDSSVSD